MAPRPTILTLAQGRRRAYFRVLLALFVLAAPVLFLYATGYRFERLTGLMKTGGIYVGAELSGTEIYLNGELIHETGTFRRAFFIDDLAPETYTIAVRKDGYHPWEKTLAVFPHRVTEAQAFNMPQEPVLTLIPRTLTNQSAVATSTRPLPNQLYEELLAAFAPTTATSTAARAGAVATSTQVSARAAAATTTKAFRGMELFERGDDIVARWTREAESVPFYFCVNGGQCASEITLNTLSERPSHFDFFPGTADLVLVVLKSGVYVTELDNRSGQNIQPLFLGERADFRVIAGGIYVKTTDADIYKVEI